ncbi:hypothetical protein ACQEU3_38580 [Spirillospora sp. CA-253888]
MRRMVKSAHPADTTRKAADIAVADERERRLYKAITEFREKARDALGNAE